MNRDIAEGLNWKDWPLPEPFLIELGRLAVTWSALEWQLNQYLGKVAGFEDAADPRPFILILHASFPQKLDMLSALCYELEPKHPRLASYKATVEKLRAAQRQRNRFMHNSLSFDPEIGKVTIAVGSARGTIKASVEEVETTDIRLATMAVHVAMVDLHSLVTGVDYKPVWER